MIDPVLCRRSIRKYQEKKVEDIEVRRLLSAAMCAPSAEDERPWHFVVIHDPAKKNELSEAWSLAYAAKNASVVIVVCGEEELQKQQGCWMLDCAAASENILIEAQYLGFGAVWLGIYPVEGKIQRIRSILGLPTKIIPFSMIPLGFPNERKDPAVRFDKGRVHLNNWTGKGKQ